MAWVTEDLLAPVRAVVEHLRDQAQVVETDQLMLVGSWCRDSWHFELGQDFATRATHDIDLALALADCRAFE